MKKKFLGILLSLSLIVSLVPASVFADDSLRGDLNGDGKVDTKDVDLLQQYLEGDADLNDMQKKVADMDDNDVIDINDLTALQEQLKLAIFNVNVEYGHASVARTEVNKAAYNTKVTITAEAPFPGMKFIRWEVEHNSVSLADAFSATTSFVMPDKDVKIAAVFETSPESEEITLTIPYKTTVVQAGNVKPGKTTFNLEFINGDGTPMNIGEEGSFENVKVKASVTTNGAGNYSAKMTITGTFKQLNDLLGEGAYVRQIDAGKEGWKYDDAVWALFMKKNSGNEDGEIAEMAVSDGTDADGSAGYSAVIYPTTYEDKEYSIVWTPSDMSFENVYDVSTDVEYDGTEGGDSNKDSGSDADKSSKTGDDTNLALLFALLGLSAAGLVGTGVYGRRKVDSHMK